ncbi:MAG: hypothetical protein AAGC84_09450, partial [Pseudomonas sp.]
MLKVTAKTVGGDVRQIVGMGALSHRVLARPCHGDVQHFIHGLLRDWALPNTGGLRLYASSKAGIVPNSKKFRTPLINNKFYKQQRASEEALCRSAATVCRRRQCT